MGGGVTTIFYEYNRFTEALLYVQWCMVCAYMDMNLTRAIYVVFVEFTAGCVHGRIYILLNILFILFITDWQIQTQQY